MCLTFIHWNVDPEITTIGSFSVRYYGLLFAGGLLVCAAILKRIFKREQISLDHLDTLTIYGVFGIFLGARLGHCLFYDPEYYFSHPLEMLLPIQQTSTGEYQFTGYLGLASHGGIIGLIVALLLYARSTKESLIRTLDLISVVAPLAGFFIRLANLMNSEILGFPTQVPWAFIFVRVDDVPRHPAQLYEAIAYLAIFCLMLVLYRSGRYAAHRGFFFGLSIALVFTARFFIEFLKERQVDFENQMLLDMGQLLSVPFILIGFGFALYSLLSERKIRIE